MLFERKVVRKREREKKYLKFNIFGPESGLLLAAGIGYLWKDEAIQSAEFNSYH